MEIKKIETKPNVNNFVYRPFFNEERKGHHNSNEGFKDTLKESIEELKKENESFDEVANQVELTPRDIQLMELRRSKMNLEQVKNFEDKEPNIRL